MTPNAEFWCKICKLPFATDGAFKKHKVNSAKHICCDVCGTDFNTEEGKKRHRAAHHAEEQDLTCKFCGRNYPRVGSLIHHYEESQCKNVSKETFKEAIKDSMGHQHAIRAAHNFKDIRRAGGFTAGPDEPLPPFRQAPDSSQISNNDMVGGWSGAEENRVQGGWSLDDEQDGDFYDGGWPSPAPTGYGMDSPLITFLPDVPIKDDEDLIDLDPASEILNSPWSVPASEVLQKAQKAQKTKEYSLLGSNGLNRGTGYDTGKGPGQVSGQSVGGKVIHSVVNQGSTNRGPPHTWGKSTVAPASNSANPTSTVPPHPEDKMSMPAAHAGGNAGTAAAPKQSDPTSNTAWSKLSVSVANPEPRTNSNAPWFWEKSVDDLMATQTSSTQLTVPSPAVLASGQQTMSSSIVTQAPSNPWGTKELFPDAPSAIAPPVDLLESLAIAPAPATVYRDFDPSDPAFRASRYYVEFLRKWKCPHPGCNHSSKTAQGLIGHLNSPAHRDEKYQCFRCYRYFSSATALAQHAESQGVRCNLRETNDFESVVRGITADTTTTNGRLADDTIRYEINPNAVLGHGKMAENFRAAQKLVDENKANYWKTHRPKW